MKEPNFRGASELPPDQADIRRQQETGKLVDKSLPSWLRDGRLVSGSLTDDDTKSVTHGLKRAPKGWVLMTTSGDADRICVVQVGSDSSILSLKNTGATGALAFSLWVF